MDKFLTNSHGIPGSSEFTAQREIWRKQMSESIEIRKQAIELTESSSRFLYGYQWEWCGVPIIRHPDDIVLQQEIMWSLRPGSVIETGIARGGSLVLSSTLMNLYGGKSKVLGIDNQILAHTTNALEPWTKDGSIEIHECDSTSELAKDLISKFLDDGNKPSLLVLDSNHTHKHVLSELELITPLLASGSIIIVADTIINEMPSDFYPNRPWNQKDNPLTAVNQFLAQNKNFRLAEQWSRRSLMGECRDGILVKVY